MNYIFFICKAFFFISESNGLEVLNAMTGRQEGENFSRLCKRKFLERFCKLVNQLPTSTEIDAGALKCLSYGEIKALATCYQVRYFSVLITISSNIILILIDVFLPLACGTVVAVMFSRHLYTLPQPFVLFIVTIVIISS